MAEAPDVPISTEEALALLLFAQRSPNADFREQAFQLALGALEQTPDAPTLRPFAEFAARSKATGASAETARAIARRRLRASGQAELYSQFARSASRQRDPAKTPPPRSRPRRGGK